MHDGAYLHCTCNKCTTLKLDIHVYLNVHRSDVTSLLDDDKSKKAKKEALLDEETMESGTVR